MRMLCVDVEAVCHLVTTCRMKECIDYIIDILYDGRERD